MSVLVIFSIIVFLLLGERPIIFVLAACFIGWLLCDINIEKDYTWYSGIWHGIFFLPNFLRHLIWDSPYKADFFTNSYNVFYWIFSILSTFGYLFGGNQRRDQI